MKKPSFSKTKHTQAEKDYFQSLADKVRAAREASISRLNVTKQHVSDEKLIFVALPQKGDGIK